LTFNNNIKRPNQKKVHQRPKQIPNKTQKQKPKAKAKKITESNPSQTKAQIKPLPSQAPKQKKGCLFRKIINLVFLPQEYPSINNQPINAVAALV
jgi:hypothetical protein